VVARIRPSPADAWFAETGAVVLASVPAAAPPADDALVVAFVDLARDRGWRAGVVGGTGGARGRGSPAPSRPLVPARGFDPAATRWW
jgi:hypothetical protein